MYMREHLRAVAIKGEIIPDTQEIPINSWKKNDVRILFKKLSEEFRIDIFFPKMDRWLQSYEYMLSTINCWGNVEQSTAFVTCIIRSRLYPLSGRGEYS